MKTINTEPISWQWWSTVRSNGVYYSRPGKFSKLHLKLTSVKGETLCGVKIPKEGSKAGEVAGFMVNDEGDCERCKTIYRRASQ